MRMNSRMRTLHLLCLLPLLGLCSCSWLLGKAAGMGMFDKQLAKNDKRVGEAKVIGVIELVNPEQNYVLINCEQRLNIPAGTEILAQNPDGSKAKLKVSPERKGNYITADITEGTPQLRDIVLYQVKPGELPAQNAVPGAAPGAPPEGPPVQLTPIMQADVIPPLDTPFQPMSSAKPAVPPVQPVAPQPAPAPPPPAKVTPAEPEPDLSKLPPVIR